MTIEMWHGDCLTIIPELVRQGRVVDSIICDPPYGLEFMGKDWDSFADVRKAQRGTLTNMVNPNGAEKFKMKAPAFDLSPRGRASYQAWCEAWAREAIQILKPGGYLIAFGGTRTHHRLACAIEDAGFVIQDSILEMIASDTRTQRFLATLSPGQIDAFSAVLDEMQPGGALQWCYGVGFPKNRFALKPAYEPIVLAYKPGGKRTMQIDECRIDTDAARPWREARRNEESDQNRKAYGRGLAGSRAIEDTTVGRWPANIVTDGSDEVLAAFPDSAGQQGDVRGTEPSAVTDAVYGQRARVPFNKRAGEASAERRYTEEGASDFAMLPGARRSDGGSAARFFFSAKAGSQDRWGSRHPTVKPIDLIAWLIALVTPSGGTFLDPFAGSGTAGVAALKTGRNAILIEREEAYISDIRERMAHYAGEGKHSTVAKARSSVPRGTMPLFGD